MYSDDIMLILFIVHPFLVNIYTLWGQSKHGLKQHENSPITYNIESSLYVYFYNHCQ